MFPKRSRRNTVNFGEMDVSLQEEGSSKMSPKRGRRNTVNFGERISPLHVKDLSTPTSRSRRASISVCEQVAGDSPGNSDASFDGLHRSTSFRLPRKHVETELRRVERKIEEQKPREQAYFQKITSQKQHFEKLWDLHTWQVDGFLTKDFAEAERCMVAAVKLNIERCARMHV